MDLKATPRNRYTGSLADALLSAKSAGDRYEVKDWVPLLGGTGLGQLFMGQAPELVDDVSYYGPQALIRGGNEVAGRLGTLAPDKRIFDAAMLGLDTYGLSKGIGASTKAVVKTIPRAIDTFTRPKFMGKDVPKNPGRREFAKKAGAIGLGSTALMKAVKYLEDIAPVAKHPKGWEVAETSVEDGAKVASKHKFNSLKEYNDYLNKTAEEEAISINRAMGYNNTAKPHEMASHRNIKSELARNDESIYNAAKNYDKYGDAIYDESMKWDPYDQEMFKASKEAFSPQAKAEMKAFKNLNESVAHRHYEEMVEKGRQSLGSYYRKPPYEDYQRMIYNQNSRWVDYLDDYVKNPKIFDNISY